LGGIFGILNLDGQPVAREHSEVMHASVVCGGPDGSSIRRNENASGGHLLLCNTFEARHENLSHQHPASEGVFTANARIDHREEGMADR
jgi:hypothetical protein